MVKNSHSARIEKLITQDEKLAFTLLSYFTILMILLNLTFANLSPVGAIAAIVYLIINGIFLGSTLFEEEKFFLKLLLGSLLLLVFLGLVSWALIIVSNLGVVSSVIVLFIVATLTSLLNRFKTKFWR